MSKMYRKTTNGLVTNDDNKIVNFTTYEEAQQALGSTLVEGQIISINAPTGNGIDLEASVNNIAALIPSGTSYPNNMLVNASQLSDLDVGALSNRVNAVSTRIDGLDSVVSTLNTTSGIHTAAISSLSSNKQDKQLSTVVSIANSTFNTVETALQGIARLKADLSRVTDIENVIPSNATSSNKLSTSEDVDLLTSSITTINSYIPSGTSSSNKLTNVSTVSTMIAANPAFSMLLSGTTLTITSLS